MTPYAAVEALIQRNVRLRSFAVRSVCFQLLKALVRARPDRLSVHVRYFDNRVTLVYWPEYSAGFDGTPWQPGMLMETRAGVRFFNELEGRVLLRRDDVAAGLHVHLPALRLALHRVQNGLPV